MATTKASLSFERTGALARGYDMDQVDTFFARARVSYEQGGAQGGISSREVRRVAFDLVRGGYGVPAVDSALDRMEDAFTRREVAVVQQRLGPERALTELTARAATLRGRLARPDGERFDRARGAGLAYDCDDVDDLCERLLAYFEADASMGPDDVRRSVFRARRGRRGYAEHQVDAFCDRAVEVLAAFR